jgi:EAL domain-containing protein (putative c-di-GMP-specific phosphodiesterase class I)
MMLGVMLARSGIEVVVLEKYADCFRDFRGGTIHASTLQMMDELGWLGAFLALRHAYGQARAWAYLGIDVRVCVNVSTVQFARPDVVDLVATVLVDSNLPAERLELELT